MERPDERPAGPNQTKGWRAIPHWQATIAVVGVGLIYTRVPQRLRVGPAWLLLAAELLLLIPLYLTHVRGRHDLTHWLGRAVAGLATLAVSLSALFLLTRLPGGKIPGSQLLREAGLIYVANVLVFALWYWEVDGGGPIVRRPGWYRSTDFVFPQFQQDLGPEARVWVPDFIDYLFLAFNTTTAFSPTDTMVLSKRAKLLMMTQSVISLVVIGVLAARAINTL